MAHPRDDLIRPARKKHEARACRDRYHSNAIGAALSARKCAWPPEARAATENHATVPFPVIT